MTVEQGPSIFRLPNDYATEAEYTPEPRQSAGDNERPLVRILVVLALFGLFGLILAGQLVRYQAFGLRNRVQGGGDSVAAPADPALPRGGVFDANGYPLAIESYYYEIVAAPNQINEKDRAAVAHAVAPMVGRSEAEMLLALTENKDAPYLLLADGVGPEVGEEILAWDVFTVTAKPLPRRYYPEGRLFCHGLGFVGTLDRVGYYGLEGQFNDFLRATTLAPRWLQPPQAVGDSELVETELPDSEFLPTYVQQDLVLTVDRIVQHMAEQALKDAIKQHEAEGGTVIILQPHSSAVLAMASWPDFNPNDYGREESMEVYVNPATSKLYEPGSVFKLVTYAAALEKGVITPESKYEDEDEFVYGERVIKNWDEIGRGEITAAEALAQSLNVTTAKIAVDLGRDEFYKAVQRFRFGENTGIELANEVPGIVKVPGKGSWYPADLATNSFGQGISVTPLQMANAVAAIASEGVLYRPHVIKQIIDGEKLIAIEPQAVSRAISPETAQTLTQLMVDTVDRIPTAQVPGYAIAGKSGTAEIVLAEGYADELTIASFGGFFPADDPQFVILVKLDRPKTSRWATQTAAPLFQTIVKNLIQLDNIPPDDVRLDKQASDTTP